jgi:hypothetical protein
MEGKMSTTVRIQDLKQVGAVGQITFSQGEPYVIVGVTESGLQKTFLVVPSGNQIRIFETLDCDELHGLVIVASPDERTTLINRYRARWQEIAAMYPAINW